MEKFKGEGWIVPRIDENKQPSSSMLEREQSTASPLRHAESVFILRCLAGFENSIKLITFLQLIFSKYNTFVNL